jgi:hypothetical protein
MKTPPKWLTKLDGTDGIAVKTQADGRTVVTQEFPRLTVLLWGRVDNRGRAGREGLTTSGGRLRAEVLEAARQAKLIRQEKGSLSEEDKWLLRAEHIDQPKTGTGHKPGLAGTWMERNAPTELVDYLKRAIELGRHVKIYFRWPKRYDETIRTLARKYGCEIPAGINFIKKESATKAWGPAGHVTFENPPNTPTGRLVKEIVAENMVDEHGRPLKVVELANGRTRIIDVHLVYCLFLLNRFAIS